jgi:DNA-directed RNA polymerase subunit RPC12/RpoP
MPSPCVKCGAPVASPWQFCPECGAAVAHEPAIPRHHDRAPLKAVFGGLLLGSVTAPILIIVGCLLCLTGLGAFLGVPMIVAGIISPIMGPVIGFKSARGNCPWCGAPVSCVDSEQSFECDACKQRIAVKDHTFVTVA